VLDHPRLTETETQRLYEELQRIPILDGPECLLDVATQHKMHANLTLAECAVDQEDRRTTLVRQSLSALDMGSLLPLGAVTPAMLLREIKGSSHETRSNEGFLSYFNRLTPLLYPLALPSNPETTMPRLYKIPFLAKQYQRCRKARKGRRLEDLSPAELKALQTLEHGGEQPTKTVTRMYRDLFLRHPKFAAVLHTVRRFNAKTLIMLHPDCNLAVFMQLARKMFGEHTGNAEDCIRRDTQLHTDTAMLNNGGMLPWSGTVCANEINYVMLDATTGDSTDAFNRASNATGRQKLVYHLPAVRGPCLPELCLPSAAARGKGSDRDHPPVCAHHE
jgi:hypothetical protein